MGHACVQEPLFKDGSGTPKRVGVVFDQIDKGTYLHGPRGSIARRLEAEEAV